MQQKFCCFSCSTRGACLLIAAGKVCLDVLDLLLFLYQWVFPETIMHWFHFTVLVVDIALCFPLVVGALMENRRLVMSWVWASLVILTVQACSSVYLVVEKWSGYKQVLWIMGCTFANLFQILVVSSYGALMGVEENKWRQLEQWAEGVQNRENRRCEDSDEGEKDGDGGEKGTSAPGHPLEAEESSLFKTVDELGGRTTGAADSRVLGGCSQSSPASCPQSPSQLTSSSQPGGAKTSTSED